MSKREEYLRGEDMDAESLREAEQLLHIEDMNDPEASLESDASEFYTPAGHNASSFLLQVEKNIESRLSESDQPVVVGGARKSTTSLLIGSAFVAIVALVGVVVATLDNEQTEPNVYTSQQVSLQSESTELEGTTGVTHQNDIQSSPEQAPLDVELTSDRTLQEPQNNAESPAEVVAAQPIEQPVEQPRTNNTDTQAMQLSSSASELQEPEQERVAIRINNPAVSSEIDILNESIELAQTVEEKMDLHLQLSRVFGDAGNHSQQAKELQQCIAFATSIRAEHFLQEAQAAAIELIQTTNNMRDENIVNLARTIAASSTLTEDQKSKANDLLKSLSK